MRICLLLVPWLVLLGIFLPSAAVHAKPPRRPIDVIISTDLGTDIDDTFALAHLLALSKPTTSDAVPLLNVLCIITATSDTLSRLKILGKLLTDSGSTYSNIPIVQGVSEMPLSEEYLEAGEQAGFPWAASFDLSTYRGPVVYENEWLSYVRSLLSSRPSSSPPLIFLELAPPTNSAVLLSSSPALPPFPILAMSGSVYLGYDALPPAVPEFNVKGFGGSAVSSSCVLYNSSDPLSPVVWAPPPSSLTPRLAAAPLDVSGLFRLTGAPYRVLRHAASSGDLLMLSTLSHYADWVSNVPYNNVFNETYDVEEGTTTLWDVVAVGLFLQQVGALGTGGDLFNTKDLIIKIGEDGTTNVVEGSDIRDKSECQGLVREALEWTEGKIDEFAKLYVDTLLRRVE